MPSSPQKGDDQPPLGALLPLAKAAELSRLSPAHLRLLVRNGEVWGVKLGRNWFTTAQAVKEYKARNIRRGRKPKKAQK
jgi:hypothetical protein